MNTKQITCIIALLSLLAFSGCGSKSFKADLTTPEGALLSLENAYRAQDIEKAVACKDFKAEAAYMMRTKFGMSDETVLTKLAETLELAYRAEMKKGFPDMKGVTSTFPKKKDLGDGKMVVTEVCRYPDGGSSKQNMLVVKTSTGWKVTVPLE